MIDPKAIVSYAQYSEDIILLALLYDVKKGFYIDVGANYPTTDSVTKLFYIKGWHGINIEPIESLYKELCKERPRDINLKIGISDKCGFATFKEYSDLPGHSTFDLHSNKNDEKLRYKSYKIKVDTLNQVFIDNKIKHVNFLKIDVEGYEYNVVSGNNWKINRPEIVCIEANHINKDWRSKLLDNDYKLFINDGLNEYYVRDESWYRIEGFAERAIDIAYHSLRQHQAEGWDNDSNNLTFLTKQVESLDKYNKQLSKQLNSMVTQLALSESLTLKNKSLRQRIKRSAHGLTVDWVRFKKKK